MRPVQPHAHPGHVTSWLVLVDAWRCLLLFQASRGCAQRKPQCLTINRGTSHICRECNDSSFSMVNGLLSQLHSVPHGTAQILCSHRASVDTAIATENHNWVFRSNPRRLLMLSPNSDKMTDSPGGNSVTSCRSTKLWYTRKSEASHVLEGCPAVPF